MRRFVVVSLVVFAAGVVVSLAAGSAAAPAGRWVIRDLGTLGGRSSEAVAINERGQIVGSAERKGFQWARSKAFLWENGTMRDLGTLPGGDESRAVDINGRGQVAVWAETNPQRGTGHAALWQNGTLRDLGTLGGRSSEPLDVNDEGQAVGSADTMAGAHAFSWSNGRMRDLGGPFAGTPSDVSIIAGIAVNERGQVIVVTALRNFGAASAVWENGERRRLGTLGGPFSWARDINDHGQIVGSATTTETGGYLGHLAHACLWQNGKIRDLGTLGGPWPESYANAINERGDVVGTTSRSTAFLWRDGRMRDLGALPGDKASYAADLNERGQIVGWSATSTAATTSSHAFVWQSGRMTDLGTLGGRASEALDINDRGQIVGWAQTPSGARHAVLWVRRS